MKMKWEEDTPYQMEEASSEEGKIKQAHLRVMEDYPDETI